VQKKVWPYFPLQTGAFSLLDFGHSKVEIVALEEIKLVNIEFKKHNLQKVASNHMASCNLKKYKHEESPYNEMFQGEKSYPEVLRRLQALSPDKMIYFHNFQNHQRSSLPKVLQGENQMSPATQKTETQNLEATISSKQEALENLEKSEVSTQKEDIPEIDILDNETKYQVETLAKKGEDRPLSSPDKSTTDGTEKQLSTEIENPIQVVMPLQFTRENPNVEVILIGYLMPIPIEEIPPSDFFFSKKRKVVVKKKMH
jgi:hypothetical protein